ncbi:MAG: tetratricopeptide repeat protein [Deltaproteobacteria bacterium]
MLAAALGSPLVARAQSSAAAVRRLERRAQQKMRELDFEGALPLLDKLVKSPALKDPERADSWMDLGITLVNLGRESEARDAFTQALTLDPKRRSPSELSPAIQQLFEEARRSLAPEPPPVVVAEPPPPVAAPKPPEARENSARLVEASSSPPVAPVPESLTVASSPPSTQGMNLVPPLVLESVAAVALGVGIWAAEGSASAAGELQSGLRSGSAADGLRSQQGTLGTLALGAYAIAATTAAAGLISYVAQTRPSGHKLVAPIAVGALAALSLGVGIWAGESSQTAAVALRSSLNPGSTAALLTARQSTFANVAIGAYTVGGAALLLGGILAIVELRATGEPPASDSGGPTATPLSFTF